MALEKILKALRQTKRDSPLFGQRWAPHTSCHQALSNIHSFYQALGPVKALCVEGSREDAVLQPSVFLVLCAISSMPAGPCKGGQGNTHKKRPEVTTTMFCAIAQELLQVGEKERHSCCLLFLRSGCFHLKILVLLSGFLKN